MRWYVGVLLNPWNTWNEKDAGKQMRNMGVRERPLVTQMTGCPTLLHETRAETRQWKRRESLGTKAKWAAEQTADNISQSDFKGSTCESRDPHSLIGEWDEGGKRCTAAASLVCLVIRTRAFPCCWCFHGRHSQASLPTSKYPISSSVCLCLCVIQGSHARTFHTPNFMHTRCAICEPAAAAPVFSRTPD